MEGSLGQFDTVLEDELRQRFRLLGFNWLVLLIEELKILPVVEDQEMGLVLAGAEQVFGKAACRGRSSART